MMKLTAVVLFMVLSTTSASNCSFSEDQVGFACPSTSTDTTYAVCEGESLESNIIFRCLDGCPTPGNCNDNLAGVPPYGVKRAAACYQDSRTAGNAQCTFDCVNVTAVNGTVFYPLGCSYQIDNTTGPPVSTSISHSTTQTTSHSGSATTTATSTGSTSSPTASGNAAAAQGSIPGTIGLLGCMALAMDFLL